MARAGVRPAFRSDRSDNRINRALPSAVSRIVTPESTIAHFINSSTPHTRKIILPSQYVTREILKFDSTVQWLGSVYLEWLRYLANVKNADRLLGEVLSIALSIARQASVGVAVAVGAPDF